MADNSDPMDLSKRLEGLEAALGWALRWIVGEGVVPESVNRGQRPAAPPSDIKQFDQAARLIEDGEDS